MQKRILQPCVSPRARDDLSHGALRRVRRRRVPLQNVPKKDAQQEGNDAARKFKAHAEQNVSVRHLC